MNAFIEGDVGSLERVAGHGADHVGGIDQRFRRQQRQDPIASIACVPLISEMASLASSTSGLICALLQRLRAGNARASRRAFAFADQHQRQMRQRRQIAACAHAALRRHQRRDAAVQHLADRVDDNCADAGVSLGERIGAQQHHGAGFSDGKRFADADRMRAHQDSLAVRESVRRQCARR